MESAELLATLRDLEVALHQPDVRSDRVKLGDLLHLQFREFGRSGAEYARENVLVEFESSPPSYDVWSQDFRVDELAPGVALLTYRSAHLCAVGECGFTRAHLQVSSRNMQPNHTVHQTRAKAARAGDCER